MQIYIFVVLTLVLSTLARAQEAPPFQKNYIVALLAGAPTSLINHTKRTHFVVGGPGDSATGFLFQQAAASQGKRYAEIFPEDQVVLIVDNMHGNGSGVELSYLQRFGYTPITDAETVSEELAQFSQIASLDIFSHAWTYVALEFVASYPVPDSILNLRPLFTADSWVKIYGCNAGWSLAPYLAAAWGVPVAGALTSTNFEGLHSTLSFYPNDPGLFPTGPWAQHNQISFLRPQDCYGSGCLRMKPDNHSYEGTHGALEKGLPFYKFFCISISSEDCERRMALSLTASLGVKAGQPAMGASDYEQMLSDFLCPIHPKYNWRGDCIEGIQRSLRNGKNTYHPFESKLVQCSFLTCNSQLEQATTFMEEYKAYKRGFALLKRSR